MKRATVDRLVFYCDTISPYAYFCAHLLKPIASKHKVKVEVQPTLFAGLLNSTGMKGPAEVPLRRKYLLQDCLRLGALHNLPFTVPPHHPYNPLLALRSAHMIDDADARYSYVTALLSACWGEGKDLTDPKVLEGIAQSCQLPSSIVSDTTMDVAKAKLRDATNSAIEKGVFGVPTVMAGSELFWGSDRLHHLDSYLSGQLSTIDKDKLDSILATPRGSDRIL